jgi:peptide/nickel transport system ATP-binding protein
MTGPLLQVSDLRTRFLTDDGAVQAVNGVSFDLHEGEALGIVGESGCGKSMTALSIMGLVPEPGRVVGGEIRFRGQDLLRMRAEDVREIRGRDIAMIFQDPLSSLNPVLKNGFQIEEAMLAHRDMPRRVSAEQAVSLLKRVHVPAAEARAKDYPHQLSGGMRQRTMIAMGLANEPAVLIADEPTTALDVTVQAQILELIDRIKHEFDIGVILITHDLGVIAEVAQTVMVMYAGRAMERAATQELFTRPQHPYTWGLLESIPRAEDRSARLVPIEGSPPSLIFVPPGCPFHPRCPHRFALCDQQRPEFRDRGGGHPDACHLSGDDKRRLWAERLETRMRVAV